MEERLIQHRNKAFGKGFTSKADDWEIFLEIKDLEYLQARKIEGHIKRMKSRIYIENLARYPDIIKKLKQKY
jgi:putative endonuclease